MPARLPLALGAGIASALLFLPFLGFFLAPAPLIAAGFRQGWSGGVLAAMVGTAGVAVVSLQPLIIGIYLVVDVLPALAILRWALRPAPGVTKPDPGRREHWVDAGAVLAPLALVPAVALGVIAAMPGTSMQDLAWRMTGGESVESFVTNATAIFGPEAGAMIANLAAQPQADQLIAGSLLASMATLWLVQAIVAAMLGVALARRLGPVVRPRPAYGDLRLPGWFGAAFVAMLGLSLLGGDLGLMAGITATVLGVPFMLLGFKLVHLAARKTPAPGLLLAVFYLLCLFMFAIVPVVMVFVGLVEFATDVLRRASGRSMEDE